MNDQNASQIFAALGHPARVSVLRKLVQAGCCGLSVGQLRGALNLPASTFAHHLKALADAGVIEQKRQGREIISTANYAAIQSLVAFLLEDCCKGVFATDTSEMETS